MNDYPVKYALIPFYKNELCGYMVVKCYILDIISEKKDDKTETFYRVSYPIDDNNYNYEVGITHDLFNSYEEANEVKMNKNRKLINEKTDNCLIQNRKDMYIKFRNNLEELGLFESLLSDYGKDLKVSKGKVKTRSL